MKGIIKQLDKNSKLSISTTHEKTTQNKRQKFKETGYKTLVERLTNELALIIPLTSNTLVLNILSQHLTAQPLLNLLEQRNIKPANYGATGSSFREEIIQP